MYVFFLKCLKIILWVLLLNSCAVLKKSHGGIEKLDYNVKMKLMKVQTGCGVQQKSSLILIL